MPGYVWNLCKTLLNVQKISELGFVVCEFVYTFLEAELPPETTGTKPRGKIPPNPLAKQLELANPVSYLG